MVTVLVTGINGFVGKHVAKQLFSQGINVLGASNQPRLSSDLQDIVKNYTACDLTNPRQVRKFHLNEIDAIINLAGFAKVGVSSGKGDLYNRVNVGVHAVLYEECLKQRVNPRIIAVSTGAIYDPQQWLPLGEKSAIIEDDKTNEYVISKKHAEESIRSYIRKGLDCIIVRPFNHIGPGQLAGFILPDLAENIEAAMKTGQPVKVGNLHTKRDFTDVRDVARAYVELAIAENTKLTHKVYNVCSGHSVSGEQLLEMLIEAYGTPEIKVKTDRTLLRKYEVMDIFGSHEAITSDTGWEPSIPINQTIIDFVTWKTKS